MYDDPSNLDVLKPMLLPGLVGSKISNNAVPLVYDDPFNLDVLKPMLIPGLGGSKISTKNKEARASC